MFDQGSKLALLKSIWILLLAVVMWNTACIAGEKQIIQLKDFSQTEVKSGGFSLPRQMDVHIRGLGGATERSFPFNKTQMFAYAWIINADTRELVWKMERSNTSKEKKDRKFDAALTLPKGNYEIYYSAYGFASGSTFSNFSINVDRRKNSFSGKHEDNTGILGWFGDFFGDDVEKEWNERSRQWYVELYVNDNDPAVGFFTVPREFSNVLFKAVKLGESEHIRQAFIISKSIPMRIYAIGEMVRGSSPVDYGWIINAKTRKRVWEMGRDNVEPAGGDEKNIKYDGEITLPAGEYTLYFNTDDSHSFVDWNAPPPNDPLNYGITLMATNDKAVSSFKLSSNRVEEQNVIVQLIRVTNDQTRSATFALKEETPIRVYALGEAAPSHAQEGMADCGWIINSKTRERVWTMDYNRTDHAGGAEKNRMIDEVITLPPGEYTVFYRTDDSHAYDEWNSDPPYDPDHWGISLYGEGENYNPKIVETNPLPANLGIIAQIVKVGNDAKRTVSFKLEKAAHVRIYAIGEGQNREMYDYGWIEDARNGNVVWEMTYSMTFHAGGGRKNRMVNTTILLDKGEYVLHYVSDDSHSYNDWNTDPPDDPAMWGITVYEEH